MVQPASAELISRFIHEEKRRHAENTVKSRLPLLLRLARSHNGDLLGLTGEDIERWLDDTKVTRATRNTYLGSLSGFYRWAVRRGALDHSPCDDILRIRTPRGLPRPIRPDDLDRALAAADPKMRAWLSLMAFGGLRCAEVAGLDVDDLLWHLEPPMVHLRPPQTAGTAGPKGGNQRLIPLARTTEDAIVAYGIPRAGPLFRRAGSSEPVSPGYVSKTVNAHLDDLGIHATAHQLRHYFGTAVYLETRDLRAVQELLGHSSPDTTAIYASYSSSEAAAVVRGLSVSAGSD